MEARQTANPLGSGNVVVQIVGEHNAISIADAVALQLRSYEGAIFTTAPAERSRAGEPGYTKTGRRETRILYPYNRNSLPLQGRADLLGRLRDWLHAPDVLSVQTLIGGGGRGKTRLAVELTAEARAEGWIAGFARREELDVFRGGGCRTAWNAPSLVVIDYAAAKSPEIAAWLRTLVHEAENPDASPLRLLLLERLGGEGVAWWREVFGGADPEGEAICDMLAPGAPLTVGPLSYPEERHAVFAAAFREASGAEPPSRHPALDYALDQASLGGDPLFLAMFGLAAARQGWEAAKAVTADRIALDLAKRELDRIGRVWQAHGLPVGKDRPLHAHLAAIATLCEGLTEPEAHAAIARKSAALHKAIAEDATDQAWLALHTALPAVDRGISPVLPDILGSAVLIQTWAEGSQGYSAIKRTAREIHDRSMNTVLRTMRDFPHHPAPRDWILALQEAGGVVALKTATARLPSSPYQHFGFGTSIEDWRREALAFIDSQGPRIPTKPAKASR